MDNKLFVGQKLWFVPNYHYAGTPREVTIVKIGRKWAHLSGWRNERIDIETLEMDGSKYSSPGQCYLNRADYGNQVKIETAWRHLHENIGRVRCPPKGMTIERILEAQKLLGLEVKDES